MLKEMFAQILRPNCKSIWCPTEDDERTKASVNEQTNLTNNSPGRCTVLIQDIKILASKQFAAIHSWLNGAEASQNAHLLHIADDRYDVQSLNSRELKSRQKNVIKTDKTKQASC